MVVEDSFYHRVDAAAELLDVHSQSSASNIMNPSFEDQLHDDQHGAKGEKDSSLLQCFQSSNEMNLRGNLFLMDGGSCNSFDLLECYFVVGNIQQIRPFC